MSQTNPAPKTKRTASLRVKNMHIPSHILLILWSLIVLAPMWVLLMGSLKGKRSIYANPFGLPKEWNFSNYGDILNSNDFMTYFKNSFLVVIVALVLVLLLGTLAAYGLASWRSKLSQCAFYFIIAGMMLPIKIGSLKILELIRDLGVLDNKWSLVPVYVAIGIPISVFVLTEFVRGVPGELIESGTIDGANRLRIFRSIVVPLLRPALATVAIYNLVPFWNDMWFPLLFIQTESQKTLLLGVTRLFGQYQTDWSKVLAVLTLSAIPVMVLYLTMSKQFIKGMTAGAVKG